MKKLILLCLMSVLILSSSADALKTYYGSSVSIDTPVNDDVFASGSLVNINAPVSSAVVAGGTVNINAPVAGDVFAAGGQVMINSPVGGKVVAAGGNVNLGGNVSTNVIMAGGQINILPGAVVGRDALISGGNVNNQGRVIGNLTVSSTTFENTGSAGRVNYTRYQARPEETRYPVSPFSIIITIGYLILGLILLKLSPALFSIVNHETRSSTVLKTVVGFVMLIASVVLIFIIAITIVGIPLALITALLLAVAIMLSGIFVSFSLGQAIFNAFRPNAGLMLPFILGFVILNALFYIPYAGGIIKIIAISMGFGSILYAFRSHWGIISRHP